MKPIAIFVLVAVFSVATVAATAKVTNTRQGSQDEQSVVGVAGPAPTPVKPDAKQTARADQPSRQVLKKAKVKPKPGLNDPD